MSKAVLIVEANDARRAAIRQSLAARGLQTLEVSDPFSGLAALGRADFGAVVVAEAKRQLSLQSLIQLARKRHAGIQIFVILVTVANADQVQSMLGDVTMVPPQWGVEQLGNAINEAVEALGGEVHNPWTGDSGPGAMAVPELVSLPPLGRDPSSEGDALDLDDVALFLEGSIGDGNGAGLLMGLFSQELTGRLEIDDEDGQHSGTLYFYRGEPVWAEDKDGDAGAFRRLVGEGKIPPATRLDPLPQGALLGHLVRRGLVSDADVLEVMRITVRDHVIDLASRGSGSYAFTEDRSFLDHAPQLKINPFGLIFESRRRAYTPDKLLAIGSEISSQYLHPGPGLAVASEKLRPFMRDVDVADQIDGKRTVEDFRRATGLDHLMGTLMVLTLVDASLVSLAGAEMVTDDSVVNVRRDAVLRTGWEDREADSRSFSTTPSLADGGGSGGQGEASREELLQLYWRLKPLTAPAQVLGIPLHASRTDVESAYRARLAELDPARVPACEDADELKGHLDELRRKVQSAYETLALPSPAGGDPSRDSNPF